MVYLALTSEGLREILEAPETAKFAVWCGADAVSEAEFQNLVHGNVTRDNYSLADADNATILLFSPLSKTTTQKSAFGSSSLSSEIRTGIRWGYLPRELGCGSGMSGWRSPSRMDAEGIWQRIDAAILHRLPEYDQIDWDRAIKWPAFASRPFF